MDRVGNEQVPNVKEETAVQTTTLAIPQATSSRPPTEDCGPHAILADKPSIETPAGGVCEVSRTSPNYAMGRSLERLVGLHVRRMMLGQQNEAPQKVHIPSNLVDIVDGPCCFILLNGGDDSSTAVPGNAESTDSLVEWESLTRALLTAHICIRCVCLHILAVFHQPKGFYKWFSLNDGTVLITVVAATYADPCQDFMLPYLRRVRQVQNPQQVRIKVDGLHYNICSQEIFKDGPPEFNDRRFVHILEATSEKPYLQHFVIELEALSAPLRSQEIALRFTLNGSGDLRKSKYEVDPEYADLLCTSKCMVGRTFGVETIALPKLLALRQLTGYPHDMGPYIVTVEQPRLPHRQFLRVNAIVRRLSSDIYDSD